MTVADKGRRMIGRSRVQGSRALIDAVDLNHASKFVVGGI